MWSCFFAAEIGKDLQMRDLRGGGGGNDGRASSIDEKRPCRGKTDRGADIRAGPGSSVAGLDGLDGALIDAGAAIGAGLGVDDVGGIAGTDGFDRAGGFAGATASAFVSNHMGHEKLLYLNLVMFCQEKIYGPQNQVKHITTRCG